MDKIKGKRLLLLGSNVWKDIIRRFADEYGVTLIFAGKYPAPLDSIADEVYRVDSLDHNAMKEFISTHNIDGVFMGGSELIISHACQYINELGLPCYCTKAQWDYLQNKANFKELCIKHDLPVVPRYLIDGEDIDNAVPQDAYPVITKPTDGSGSNGFSVCHTHEELIKGYNLASENSLSGSVICEKFVNNQGLVVFYSFSNEEMFYALSEDKYPVKYEKQGSYVAGLFLCESKYKDEFRRRYEDKIRRMFQSINVKEGTIWIEVFCDGDEFYFNEVGYRYGGSFSFYPVNYFSEINQIYSDLYYSLTGCSKLSGLPSLIPDKIKAGLNYCIYPIHLKPGKIKEIKGLDELLSLSNVVVVPLQRGVGDEIEDSGSFAHVIALVHFVYSTEEDYVKMLDQIHGILHVIDENNCEMIERKYNYNNYD